VLLARTNCLFRYGIWDGSGLLNSAFSDACLGAIQCRFLSLSVAFPRSRTIFKLNLVWSNSLSSDNLLSAVLFMKNSVQVGCYERLIWKNSEYQGSFHGESGIAVR